MNEHQSEREAPLLACPPRGLIGRPRVAAPALPPLPVCRPDPQQARLGEGAGRLLID